MKTYPIKARIIDKLAGTCVTCDVNAITVHCPAAGGWYFFQIDHAGESLLSDHGAMRKRDLLLDAQDGPLAFFI